MVRTPLKQGEIIQLNNRQYTIDKVIGDGATCIVYSAYYSDGSGHPHHVNVKECYPHNVDISRLEQKLCWTSAEDKSKSITAFRNAYDKVMLCQNGNFTVHAFDIFEHNNTAYIIMDANDGVTFDKDSADSIVDILKTVKLLAHVVGEYHKNGYLHLDIKPSNFLVYPRPSEHIILFDMDTVTSLENIRFGNISGCSYSDGWAAPEQKQGKISKLCPATDIFAIGAILFEKIMGRRVEASDMGVFSDWEFDGEKFEDINPKIKRLLRNIFRKTLAANIKRRYQTTTVVLKELEKAIKVAESEVYIKGDDICCSGFFIGRENELNRIKQSFDTKKKAVFLHGFGGIGKTEIARKYVEIYKKDYDTILFVKYDNNSSLQEKLDEIDICNFYGDKAEHRKELRGLLDDKTLIIVDNFDVELGTDNGLKALLDTQAHILVSTRTDFSTVYNGDKYAQIEIKELAGVELEQVFFSNANIECLSDANKDILYKIFRLIENHTYAVELLAKQMYYSGWSIETLYHKLKLGFASLECVEKIITNKDDDTKKDNTLNILRAIYNVSSLTETQKQVLRNLYLLRFMNVTKSNYVRYALASSTDFDDMNTLVEIGLIQYDRVFYTLHSLVAELVYCDLSPNMNTCSGVYAALNTKIHNTCNYTAYDTADEFEFESNCDYICAFFKYADLRDQNNRTLLIKWLLEMFENEDAVVGHAEDIRFSGLYEKLLQLVNDEFNSADDRFNIYFILLQSWLMEMGYVFIGNSELTQHHRELVELNVRKYLSLAVSSCEKNGEKKEKCLELIYTTFLDRMLISHYPELSDLIEDVSINFPKVFEGLTTFDKKRLGVSLSEAEVEELRRVEQEMPDVFKPGYTNEEIDLEISCKKEFRKSADKVAYFNELIGDEKYAPMKKAELLWHCTTSIFERINTELPIVDISQYDWNVLEELLDLEESFLISDECDPKDRDDIQEWNGYIEDNTTNRIIVYAAKNNYDRFEETVEMLLKEIGKRASFFIKYGTHWTSFINLQEYENRSLEHIRIGLKNIKKNHLMLPVLMQFLDGWQAYARKIGQFDERYFFSLYKCIAECASDSYSEEIESPKYSQNFISIETQYRKIMDSIAGIDFSLKDED